MNKIYKNKFVIIVFLMVVFLFFGSITNTLVLNNRGIVVGMGLDCTDDGDIKVACQVLVAGSMGADNANNDNYAVLSSVGHTFGDATQKMMIDSAEFMSYAHCNTIIVGEKMIEQGQLFAVLDELLKNSKITENTNLVYYASDPEEMLKQKVGINLMASFALERMMGSSEQYADIVKCTIKDYLVAMTSDKGVCVIPEVVIEEKIDEPTSGNDQQGKDKVILSARSGVSVGRDCLIDNLTEEEVGFYNTVFKKFTRGTFSVKTEQGERSMEFVGKKVNQDYSEENLQAVFRIEGEFVESRLINDWTGRVDEERKELENRIGENLAKGIYELFVKYKQKGYDIFQLRKGFYQNYGSKIKEKTENIDKIDLKVVVKCRITT